MKIPIIVKNSNLPNVSKFMVDAYAVAVWPFIFIRDEGNPYTFNHETIHIKQQQELWVIPFYFLYFGEWIYYLIKYKDRYRAYRNISFEKEAYYNESNLTYLFNRPKMAWKYYRGMNEIL
jgi:hypothetical protein